MILDTAFLISLRDEEAAAVDLATELEAAGVPTRVPTVVIQELYVGVGAGVTPETNAQAYDALVANKPIVPLDAGIARCAGKLEGKHLMSDSKPALGPADAIVAATGLVHEEAVVTNDDDFQHVEGLAVESY